MRTDIPQGAISSHRELENFKDLADRSANCFEPARPMTDDEAIHKLFTFHPPTAETLPKFRAIALAAEHFAKVCFENMPPCDDRSIVLRMIQSTRMQANQGIALDGFSWR